MKIILTQSGGLLGRTKTASADWPHSAAQFKELVKKIKANGNGKARDGYNYFLSTDGPDKEMQVSIEHIDDKYSPVFEELVGRLKFV